MKPKPTPFTVSMQAMPMKKCRFVALLSAILGLSLLPAPGNADELNLRTAHLEILWFSTITGAPPPPEVGKRFTPESGKGLQLESGAVDADDHVVFMANRFDAPSGSQVLLQDAGSPEAVNAAITLDLPESERTSLWEYLPWFHRFHPIAAVLMIDKSNTMWVGGFTNQYMGISAPHSDAYIAKLDRTGRLAWEKTVQTGHAARVADIAPTSKGDIAVAAIDGWQSSYVSLISSSDGHPLWQRELGNGKGIAIAGLKDERLLVASFSAEGAGASYRDNIIIQPVAADGTLGAVKVIRRGISQRIGSYFGGIKMASVDDGAYVVSSWEDPFEAPLQSSEVANISGDGKLLWSKVLPDSFEIKSRYDVKYCTKPAVTALPNGDGLVACVLNGQIHLHRFARLTGDDEHASLPVPPCNDDRHPVSLFLFVLKDGSVLLGGSRPNSNVGPGCSWMGRLVTAKG